MYGLISDIHNCCYEDALLSYDDPIHKEIYNYIKDYISTQLEFKTTIPYFSSALTKFHASIIPEEIGEGWIILYKENPDTTIYILNQLNKIYYYLRFIIIEVHKQVISTFDLEEQGYNNLGYENIRMTRSLYYRMYLFFDKANKLYKILNEKN